MDKLVLHMNTGGVNLIYAVVEYALLKKHHQLSHLRLYIISIIRQNSLIPHSKLEIISIFFCFCKTFFCVYVRYICSGCNSTDRVLGPDLELIQMPRDVLRYFF